MRNFKRMEQTIQNVANRWRNAAAVRRIMPIILACLTETGCVAAGIPIMMGAMSGFSIYKTVQLSSGGTVHVEFPGKGGQTTPPEPISPVRRIAVWPGDEGDVHFAERLQQSDKFDAVASPATVSAILVETKTPSDLKQLTNQEQSNSFNIVCQRTGSELLFAARPLGALMNQNSFSFERANITVKADLLAYSCTKHEIVWRDQMALVMEVGSATGDTAEMTKVGADAWANRVLAAMEH